MSGICGILNRNNVPVNPALTDKMISAMEYWGPDGINKCSEENVSLTQFMLFNTPESVFENLPYKDPNSGNIIVSAVRIDNREELFNQLNINTQQSNNLPGSILILKAYQKWGVNCVNYLLGDFSFAIWDNRYKELFLCRDHFGITGLYYYIDEVKFYFASSMKALLALGIPKKVNELYIAQLLTNWMDNGAITAFLNIYRLPPAHYMVIGKDKFDIKCYWKLEETSPLMLTNDDDYACLFSEIFQRAVKARLRTYKPAASTLSGGLDSGAVSAVAASLLKAEGKKLKTYSSIPLYNNFPEDHRTFGNEEEFIKSTIKFSGNIESCFCKSNELSPLQSISEFLEMYSEPYRDSANLYWLTDLIKKASADKNGVLLVGQHAKGTISWPGYNHMNHSLLKKLYSKTRDIDFSTNPWKNESVINNSFARDFKLISLMQKAGYYPLQNGYSRMQILQPGISNLGFVYNELGAYYNINISDPTADKRVMEFCFSIPNDQYIRNNEIKYIFKRAMKDVLPQNVLHNSKIGLHAADIAQRLYSERTKLEDAVNALQYSQKSINYLDISKIKKILLNEKSSVKSINFALRGLACGIFLSKS